MSRSYPRLTRVRGRPRRPAARDAAARPWPTGQRGAARG